MPWYLFINGPAQLIACCIQQRLMRNCSVCRTPLPDSVPPILDVSRPFIWSLWYSEIDSVKAMWHVFRNSIAYFLSSSTFSNIHKSFRDSFPEYRDPKLCGFIIFTFAVREQGYINSVCPKPAFLQLSFFFFLQVFVCVPFCLPVPQVYGFHN